MAYSAPLQDMQFVLNELMGLAEMSTWPGFEDATPETTHSVLEEMARLCGELIAPTNAVGDREGAVCQNGQVQVATGFAQAFAAYVGQGWQGLQHPVALGGQGLPKLVAAACTEMLNAANLSFALCPLLTDGAIEALLLAGSAEQQAQWVPRLISGQCTGTMNLTEPQAGSDLAQISTKALPQADGSYRLFGQKIYITYGEHSMASNILHLVLARTPHAPEGVKGISLFLVPKWVNGPDNLQNSKDPHTPNAATKRLRNDVHCLSLEHKLGIHASPTAVLAYGSNQGEVGQGAIGYLVGQENQGLAYMFVMMNAARFQVGVQGVALASRAYQHALVYAKERVQSRPVDGHSTVAVPIVRHPDVKRMLLWMRSHTEAGRALAAQAARWADAASHHPNPTQAQEAKAFYELLVPLVKGWCTEMAVEVASLGVQVHGGMGYIEETGAAQYYRDAKILTIYEGTTAIQANDLLSRKTARNQGATVYALLDHIQAWLAQLTSANNASNPVPLQPVTQHLQQAVAACRQACHFVCSHMQTQPNAVYAGGVDYLKALAITVAGWQMARAQQLAQGRPEPFYQDKVNTCQFFADHVLSTVPVLCQRVLQGHAAVVAPDNEIS